MLEFQERNVDSVVYLASQFWKIEFILRSYFLYIIFEIAFFNFCFQIFHLAKTATKNVQRLER